MSSRRPSRARLLALVDSLSTVRIVLWGDLVLDEFLLGNVKRISREAPVLILDYVRSDFVPGGAANTAANVAALGATAVPVGVVGDDDVGRRLMEELAGRGVDVAGIRSVPDLVTPVKTRVSGAGLHTTQQQIVRIDRGRAFTLDSADRGRLLGDVEERLDGAAALTVGDYGYGSVEPMAVRRLAAAAPVVTVDSRWRLLEFAGVTAVTPNEPEVEAALGISLRGADAAALGRAVGELSARLDGTSILITRGSEGMALCPPDGVAPDLIPVYGTDEVADVTGAGDTVIATYSVALAAGGSALESALLANYAGGIVVMKQGTATVSRHELRRAVETDEGLA